MARKPRTRKIDSGDCVLAGVDFERAVILVTSLPATAARRLNALDARRGAVDVRKAVEERLREMALRPRTRLSAAERAKLAEDVEALRATRCQMLRCVRRLDAYLGPSRGAGR